MYQNLIKETLSIYHEIDRKIFLFQIATGLRCPQQCGECCESNSVEATIPECLPLANRIYRRKEAESVLASIDKKMIENHFTCVLFRPDETIKGRGRCAYYRFRPLVCRLFGFSARKNKYYRHEICLCRVVKDTDPEKSTNLLKVVAGFPDAPIIQDSFIRIASLHPGLGFRLFPINIALKNALEYLYWKHPRDIGYRKAA